MTSRRIGVVVLALLLAVVGAVSTAWAQFDTATVVGTVKDASGGSIPSAKVTLTHLETGISAVRTSNAEGNFEFVSVRPGDRKSTRLNSSHG